MINAYDTITNLSGIGSVKDILRSHPSLSNVEPKEECLSEYLIGPTRLAVLPPCSLLSTFLANPRSDTTAFISSVKRTAREIEMTAMKQEYHFEWQDHGE